MYKSVSQDSTIYFVLSVYRFVDYDSASKIKLSVPLKLQSSWSNNGPTKVSHTFTPALVHNSICGSNFAKCHNLFKNYALVCVGKY